jgi:stage II sporulation protein E
MNWQKLALCGLGFFLGRAVLLGELTPFTAAFTAAALFGFGPGAWPAIFFSLLGQATVLPAAELGRSMLVVAVVAVGVRSIPRETRNPWPAVVLIVGAAVLIVKTAFLAFGTATLYDYVAVLFEAVLASTLAYVFLRVFAVRNRPLTPEEAFCTVVLLAGVLAGSATLGYEMVTLNGVLSKSVILVAAFVGGAGIGAGVGAIVGIVPGIAYTVAPAVVGVYAFAGLLAGLGRHYGKLGVAGGFVLGSIVLAIYMDDYTSLARIMAESGIAVGILLLFPDTWRDRLVAALPSGVTGSFSAGEQVEEIVKGRMRNWAKMFAELSRTFNQVSPVESETGHGKSFQELLDEVGNRICKECPLYRSCWERDFYRTYQHFTDALETIESTGRVRSEDFPEHIRKRCLRLKELALALTCLYENHKINQYWYKRLVESREAVSEQLRGLSSIMHNLSAELTNSIEHAGRIDGTLRRKLRQLEIPIHTVEATPRDDGKLEITITRPPCHGDMACRYIVAPVVSKVIGQPFTVCQTTCVREDEAQECSFRLAPALRFQVSVGVTKIGKSGNQVSGDTHSCLALHDGKFAMLLSDGMGVGPSAALESSTTISLLEHMFESGFGQDMAVKTVNSILLLRAPDESFATVDITVIDLYSGRTEFVKIGSASSFILSGPTVRMVQSASLPVGILREIEVSSVVRNLVVNDIVVMVTDGVIDAFVDEADKEACFAAFLRDLPRVDPQQIADMILEYVMAQAGGKANDDITVLVGKIGAAAVQG